MRPPSPRGPDLDTARPPSPRACPRRPATLLALVLLASGCAHSPPDDPSDPLEPVNRAVYRFNETADKYVLRPVAKGYDRAMPAPARRGVRNFFTNLFAPTVIVNDLLQLKPEAFARDLHRFIVNTIFGLAGLFDVAGVPPNDEDFGQTLGYWGVGPGWYLMLPLLGPSNNRDLLGRIGDAGTSVLTHVDETAVTVGFTALDVVDTRASLLPADGILEQQLDRYVFVRSVYLQSRLNKVYDGNPPREDFGFDEEDAEAP